MVLNAIDLSKSIEELVKKYQNDSICSLEEYLLSLLRLVQSCKDRVPTYELFAELLDRSFWEPPMDFNKEWLEVQELPYTNYEPNADDFENSLINPETGDVVTKFEVLEKTIVFQVSTLRKYEEEDLSSEEEEENPWVNIEPLSYLIASISGLMGTDEECDWLTFADLLEYGRTTQLY